MISSSNHHGARPSGVLDTPLTKKSKTKSLSNTSHAKLQAKERSKTLGTKTSRNDQKGCDSSREKNREHSFLTDVADVRQMEHGLLQLLSDFHSGKLQAVGQGLDCSFEKMDQVRDQQERLARLHFELDNQQEIKGLDTPEGKEIANKNLNKLMENLQELCTSIQSLQHTDSSSVSKNQSS